MWKLASLTRLYALMKIHLNIYSKFHVTRVTIELPLLSVKVFFSVNRILRIGDA